MCDPVTTIRETTIFLICPKLNQNHPVFLFCDCRGDNNKSIRHGWRWKNLILFIYRLKCADYSQPVSHPFLWIFRKYREKKTNQITREWGRKKKTCQNGILLISFVGNSFAYTTFWIIGWKWCLLTIASLRCYTTCAGNRRKRFNNGAKSVTSAGSNVRKSVYIYCILHINCRQTDKKCNKLTTHEWFSQTHKTSERSTSYTIQ